MVTNPQKVSFKRGMRGYQAKQVDSYIRSLNTDFSAAEEDYQSRIVTLEKEIARLQEALQRERALREENVASKEDPAAKPARRVCLMRGKRGGEKARRAKRAPLTPEQKQARTQHFFHTGAELIRIVGKTGRKVTRIVNALPSPQKQPKPAAAPADVKAAKAHLRQLTKQEKLQKKTEKQIKKIKRQQKKLTRMA